MRTDGWTYGRIDVRTDGRTDGPTEPNYRKALLLMIINKNENDIKLAKNKKIKLGYKLERNKVKPTSEINLK